MGSKFDYQTGMNSNVCLVIVEVNHGCAFLLKSDPVFALSQSTGTNNP